jgi:hypothetical protein
MLLALPEFFFIEHIMYPVASLLALPVTPYMALLMIRDQRESLMVAQIPSKIPMTNGFHIDKCFTAISLS